MYWNTIGIQIFGVPCWVAHHSSCCLFVFQDIMISGAPNLEEISNTVKRANENHLANRLRYSLRVSINSLTLLHNTSELVADIAFCRSMLLCCICSYQITLGSYFEGKKLSVIALPLT